MTAQLDLADVGLLEGIRPDGTPLPRDKSWCGRCGANDRTATIHLNHDLGYSGCPIDSDPTWSRYPRRQDGHGWRGGGIEGYPTSGILLEDDLCDRWDRKYFPDCECGHPKGIHASGHATAFCIARCGCSEYGAVGS